jgi:hypothetical protein
MALPCFTTGAAALSASVWKRKKAMVRKIGVIVTQLPSYQRRKE